MIQDIESLNEQLINMEKRLNESEARFRSVVHCNMDGLLIVNGQGHIRFVNPAAQQILGRSVEELIGAELGFPVLTGEIVEIDLLRPGGSLTTADMRVADTIWEGRPAFLVSLRDTTARRRADAQIRFQAQLLNSVGQAVIATDLDGRIIYWNRAAQNLYGWSSSEVIGRPIIDIIPADQTREDAAAIMETLRQGASWSGEFWVRRRDGSVLPMMVTDSPIYDEQERLIGIVGVSTDISERVRLETERQQAMEDLRARTADLDRFFTCSLDLLCIANTEGYFERLNPEWERVLGYPLSELQGRRFLDLVHPDDLADTLAAIDKLRTQQEVPSFVNRYRRQDGSYCWIEWWSHPLGDKIYAAARDITIQHEFNKHIQRLNDVLRAIRNINQLITRQNDRDQLIQDTCDYLSETRGYLAAWIALLTPAGRLEAWASAGSSIAADDSASPDLLRQQLAENHHPPCIQTALGQAEPLIWQAEHHCANCLFHWAPFCQGKVAIRLAYQDRVYGLLVVSTPPSVTIDREEQDLLIEVAGDIAFALHSIEGYTALRESQERFRLAFHTNPDAIIITRLHDGLFIDVNQGFTQLTGYTREQVIGKTSLEINIWADPQDRQKLVRELQAHGHCENLEAQFRVRDGGIRIGLMSAAIIDLQGVSHILSIVHDITERVRMEAERWQMQESLQQTSQWLQNAVAASQVGLWDWNLTTDQVFYSTEWKSQIGYADNEIENRFEEWQSRVHPEDLPHTLGHIRQCIAAGQPHFQVEFRFRHKNGSYRWILTRASAFYTEDGQPLRALGSHVDITERKEAEEQIRNSLAEKQAMLSEIHHRVKNNLQIVSSLLDFQCQFVQDEQVIAALQDCRRRVHSMAMIHELLYQPDSLASIDLAVYAQMLAQDLLSAHYQRGREIELVVNIENVLVNIQQAIPCGLLIHELISNALKHAFPPNVERTSEPPRIELSMMPVGGWQHILTVSDNGIGLPDDFRFPSTQTLGMFLIDILVRQLRGKIDWSRPDDAPHGTRCRVEFNLDGTGG